MKRALALLIFLAATTASADGLQDSIVSQLRDQGFTQIQISRTLLGRSRIVATSKTMTREIVVNPATGTILRDYWADRPDQSPVVELFNPEPGTSGTETTEDRVSTDGADDAAEDASGGNQGVSSDSDGSEGGSSDGSDGGEGDSDGSGGDGDGDD